ncbi:hypothetical protein ACNOYE_29875 [Nannocystaceae bacterium ST9]
MRAVKGNRIIRAVGESAAAFVSRRIRELEPKELVPEFLAKGLGALVPIPRSGLQKPGALWPGLEIATALQHEGLGRVATCLLRRSAVSKAATSPGNRPKAKDHFDSLDLDRIELPSRITLVDDIVTRGAQMFGAAWRIWAERPDVEILGFAVIRTISTPERFESVLAPCVGRIEWRNDECFRVP